jgi:hypothetical protein
LQPTPQLDRFQEIELERNSTKSAGTKTSNLRINGQKKVRRSKHMGKAQGVSN